MRSISGVFADGGGDRVAAVLTWLVGLGLAALIVHVADRNPLRVGGAVLPIGIGAVIGAILLVWGLWRPARRIWGVAAGAYAGWMALTMGQALHGTPFPYGSLLGDEGRLMAMATKDMHTWRAVDAFVHNLPTEYPPLFPAIVGHVAAAVHRPAWQLFGEAQIVLMSFGIIAGYLLWRRLVSPPVAFLIVAISPAVYGEPSKVYEFITMLILTPWALATFVRPLPGKRAMHWLPGGVIGGLIVLTYPGFLAFSIPALLVIVVMALRAGRPRMPYLLHIGGVILTAFVVASWYVVPFAVRSLTHGGNRISDLFLASSITSRPFPLPFLDPTPLGMLELVGLVGVVWLRRRTWWAQPMLLLVLSTYAYRMLFLLETANNDHTGYLQYTDRLTGAILVAAGALTLAHVVPELRGRTTMALRRQRELLALAVIVLVAYAGVQDWTNWIPGPPGSVDVLKGEGVENLATPAHTQRLPGGDLPKYALTGHITQWFPTRGVQQAVQSVLGSDVRPETLSYDQRLYVYLPWYAYEPRNRLSANTLQRWDDRFAALQQLSSITDPAEFAQASQHLRFGGRIDVFVLRDVQGDWRFNTLSFAHSSFGRQYFRVFHVDPSTIVAVRRPAGSTAG